MCMHVQMVNVCVSVCTECSGVLRGAQGHRYIGQARKLSAASIPCIRILDTQQRGYFVTPIV